MSFNCLLCERGGSPDVDAELRNHQRGCHCCGLERSFSAKLSPPPYDNLRRSSFNEASRSNGQGKLAVRTLSNNLVKQSQTSSATGEPRLLRSGGMRRDWSFEDLRNLRNGRKR